MAIATQEQDTMGRVLTEATIENMKDLWAGGEHVYELY